jgi:hypothetical protein
MIFWLKNRKPDEWKDKREVHKKVDHTVIDYSQMSNDELRRIANAADPGVLVTEN